ncbi:MAG TPA: TrmH family RNA methyltransferase [Candidatus Nanoarchaeia archaeon]|nr:TrmH family RNA methyltransferase [Candidatus Nanoarchaeia archaeon]
MKKPDVVVLLDNVRSAVNVGAIWRTAEAAGVTKLVLTGITPHPAITSDQRLPYVVARDEAQLAKTALGAEKTLAFEYYEDSLEAIRHLKQSGYKVCAIEQIEGSTSLLGWQPESHVVLVLGTEVNGLSEDVLSVCDEIVEIPMFGRKESLNVSVAAGIILYNLLQKLL